jgi:hypothetical protein
MKRRVFIGRTSKAGLAVLGSGILGVGKAWSQEEEISLQAFAYYQGLGPNETRSSSRNDGTIYKMPCVMPQELGEGEVLEFDFWHGHGGMTHSFTINGEQFFTLQEVGEVEIYTDVIQGHRHALRLSLNDVCDEPSILD